MADLQPNAAAPAGNFQPVSEAELEGTPPPPVAQAPTAPPSGPTQGYEPVNDNDLAPTAPMFQPGFRGPRGGIPNIPAAAAQRFKDSDAFNNIFQTAATRFANGFVNTFSALTVKDQQAMRDAGYGPGDFNSAGGALRWGAHVFGSTFNVLQDGFLALGPGIIEGVGGAAEQASRETGIGDPEMVGHEASGMAEAAMADVGDMHAMSMVDAARAQAKAPGVYSHAFRVDQTPGGGIVHTPMGRLPTEAEALPQAQVAADALHLPPETADLIHQTYVETGRPPAEVLMDAKSDNGGVLSDLVAGKVPTAYEGPARGLTSEELKAANVSQETGPTTSPAETPVSGQPEGATQPEPTAPVAGTGVSKIGQSIEAKAVEANLTEGFKNTAGYDKITIADQAERSANLVNNDFDQARAVIRGEQPLPSGLKGVALVTAMEDYIKKNPSADLAYELANSPLVSATSGAAQELRLAAERTPDSATAKLQELQDAQVKQAGGAPEVAARKTAVRQSRPEANGVFLPKEQLSIDRFLNEIKC